MNWDGGAVESRMGAEKSAGTCLLVFMGEFSWSSEATNLYLCRDNFILFASLVCTSKQKAFLQASLISEELNMCNGEAEEPCMSPQAVCELTSVSRNLRSALFFLMLLRRTYTAKVRPMMTMMKRPPMTPAAIRGVLAIKIRDFTVTARARDQRVLGHIKHSLMESSPIAF